MTTTFTPQNKSLDVADYLLQEMGDYILQENGDKLILDEYSNWSPGSKHISIFNNSNKNTGSWTPETKH